MCTERYRWTAVYVPRKKIWNWNWTTFSSFLLSSSARITISRKRITFNFISAALAQVSQFSSLSLSHFLGMWERACFSRKFPFSCSLPEPESTFWSCTLAEPASAADCQKWQKNLKYFSGAPKIARVPLCFICFLFQTCISCFFFGKGKEARG